MLITVSCSSKINRLTYKIEAEEQVLYKLKSKLISLNGILMYNMSADSHLIIIDYDRYKCSQEEIEKNFEAMNLKYIFQNKEKLEKGNDELL